jgi:hypothetical protein
MEIPAAVMIEQDPAAARIARRLKFVAAILLVAFAWISVYRSGPYYTASGKEWGDRNDRSDFTVYRDVGIAVLHHTDIYEVRNDRGWAYVYPPTFAVFMIPFAWMPTWLAVFIWYCVSASLAVWAIVMSYRYAKPLLARPRELLKLAAIPSLLLAVWFGTALARSQASVIMAFLITAAVYWESRGRNIAGGIALAGAVLVKVFPILLVAYYAWQRKWKFVAAALAALMIGTIFVPAPIYGWQGNLNYIREFKHVVADPALARTETVRSNSSLYDQLFSSEKPRNQSLDSIFYRYLGQPGQYAGWAISALMACAIWWLGRRGSNATEPLILAAFITWMLVVSPVSEDHYYTLLIFPLTVAVCYVLKSGSERTLLLGTLCFVCFGLMNWVPIFYREFEVWGSVSWAAVLLWLLLLYLARVGITSKPASPRGIGMAASGAAIAFEGNASGGGK